MSRRGENIYKRKDGRWEGRIKKLDGKFQYLYSNSYKELKEKMKCFQEQYTPPEQVRLHQNQNMYELLKCWLEGAVYQRVKPSTYDNYYQCMHKYVLPFFKETKNVYKTKDLICCFVTTIWENPSIAASTKKKILTVFKTALREILKETPGCACLLELVEYPKVETKEIQVFSMQEQRLIEATIMHWEDRRALGIILCFYSGIRLGELCALKWSDFDLETESMSISRTVSRIKNYRPGASKTQLLVGMPKSKSSVRKIPLPAFLIKQLEKRKSQTVNESCYFLSGTELPMDSRMYQKLYKKILKQAGVKDRKFHAIRHTFATRALELGVDIKTLSEILGHSSVGITLNIYAHSLMEQKKLAINKFNELHISSINIEVCTVDSAVAVAMETLPVGAF